MATNTTRTPPTHDAFIWRRSTPIPSMNIELEEYTHRETGALHLHIRAEDDQNVFLVAFRTVPMDSTGVAHILEHTTLCGSRNYPVRDPFFMMTRRSLNTFMNAFTSSDWTAYPFASRNRKDFDNLLSVYLDAVFFPTLDELDFAQEGHRVEFARPDDADSDLVFKGVVFNEMKGAMSAPTSALWQGLSSVLFPTTTYHYNSGGDPEHIPDLSYEQLKAFHARHYHPSNAIFMTYGDIPAQQHQAAFEERALRHFRRADLDIRVGDEQRYPRPQQFEDVYAIDTDEDTADKTHIVIGWLLDHCTDPEALLTAHLLSGVLLDNGASPLRHALETTDLGSAPSPMCGLQDSTYEMMFACGLEGSNPEQAGATEKLVLDVLEQVAREGVPTGMVESVLHQLELSQREISGDGFPYGLHLMLQGLTPAIHHADPASALNIDPVLEQLRENIKDPDYIKGLVRRLLDNPHRVRLVMRPDPELNARRLAAEAERLAAIKAGLDEAGKQAVIERAAALARRQEQQDDPEVLPRVSLEDIPADIPIPEGEASRAGLPASWYARGTNGLVYQELVIDLPALEDALSARLPLYASCLAEVGSGGRDYLATQALQAAVTGGIGARLSVRSAIDRLERGRSLFIVSGKALRRNHAALSQLLFETFDSPRFDELARLRELVAQERLHQEQGITGHGHALAMMAASSGFSPAARFSHQSHGLAGLKALKALDESLDDEAALRGLAGQLEALREALRAAPRQLLLIGEKEAREAIEQALDEAWAALPPVTSGAVFDPGGVTGAVRQGWTTSTQVNFCARAYPTVAAEHPDAAALMVLGGFLRNNYLHRAIREQGGAYGGGAGYDADAGTFRFYSYRDPRLGETLADFEASIRWLLDNDHPWRLVEEAILGVISAIDKPGSPAGEARTAFYGRLHGRTPEQRRALRQRVLEVRQQDLKRVAEDYLLDPSRAGTAVISDPATLERHPELELEIIPL